MKNLIVLAIVAALAWQGYAAYQARWGEAASTRAADPLPAVATFFLRNCPGVQMDGNNDGVPCERQWCGR